MFAFRSSDSAQLDLNDFPALGTTQTTGSIASREGLGSYAAQAQHHASTAASGTTGPGSLTSGRDFTNPDDFPALGGASAGAGTGSGTAAGTTGENGFVRFEDKRVRLVDRYAYKSREIAALTRCIVCTRRYMD